MRARRRGQATSEYAILVGLVAILLMATVAKYAASVGKAYGATTEALEERVAQPIRWDGPGRNPFQLPGAPVRVNRRAADDPEGQEPR